MIAQRALLAAVASLAVGLQAWAAPSPFAALEAQAKGQLGVAAIDTGSGKTVYHRGDERFPFCSTFKVMLAGAVLKKGGLLEKRLSYTQADLVSHSPVTEKHMATGMTVGELCKATLQTSDNTAANLLIDLLGGPASVTAFARSIGDTTFRLDRRETELNTAIPGDPRDTTTPRAMATSLQALTLGDALAPAERKRLVDWMLGNTTGATRIQAGVPKGWAVGDKTGTGVYGTTNDIGVVFPPGKKPIVLAVYFTQPGPEAGARNDVVASATAIALEALSVD